MESQAGAQQDEALLQRRVEAADGVELEAVSLCFCEAWRVEGRKMVA